MPGQQPTELQEFELWLVSCFYGAAIIAVMIFVFAVILHVGRLYGRGKIGQFVTMLLIFALLVLEAFVGYLFLLHAQGEFIPLLDRFLSSL